MTRQPICLRGGEFYSGAETRIAAAIAHLVDLWNMADEQHSNAALAALHALLASPIGCTRARAIRDMVHDQLGYDGMTKLFDELYDDCGCPRRTHEEVIRLTAEYDRERDTLPPEDTCALCGELKRICCDTGATDSAVCADCCDRSMHKNVEQ